MTAARAAGMDVIAITHSLPREQLAHATHVVETYEEVERLLLPDAAAGPASFPASPASGPRF